MNGDMKLVVSALGPAFPNGISSDDYGAVLYFLSQDMSDEGVGVAIHEITGTDRLVVENDLAEVLSDEPPPNDAIDRIEVILRRAGWKPLE